MEDIEIIKNYKWRFHSSGYVMGRVKGKTILFYRYLMGVTDISRQVDHINHHREDNRKQNLRIVTSQQNNFNRTFKSNSVSGIKGVVWDKEKSKWVAQIKINNKNLFLGYFTDIEKAVETRIKKEIDLFGKYSNIKEMKELLIKYNIPVGKAIRFDK